MEEVEYEEQRRRKEYNKYLQQEWLNNIQEKNYYNSLPKPPDFNKDIAGKSALLQFDGEDLHKKEREQQQKNQMLKWIKEKVLENNIKKREEEIEEMNYNEMIKMVNEIRRQNEEEEEKIRRRLADEIRQENYYVRYLFKKLIIFYNNILIIIFLIFLVRTNSTSKKSNTISYFS